jgi:demethylmenaquinone methyltransferase / 2-methoxy-6-polyprenyl-1,4-benzoquinol methylase
MTQVVTETFVGQMFDRIAKRYDFLNRLLSMGQDQRWRRYLIDRVPYRENGRFLDVATGTGDILLMAAEHRPEYREYLGVDISKGMLNLAEEKWRKGMPAKAGSGRFLPMSAERLQFQEGEFDALSIGFGLRNVIDKERAINEFARVLKPDGALFILEFFNGKSGIMGKLFRFYFRHILPLIGALLSDAKAYKYLPSSVESFYPLDELLDLLRENFVILEIKSFLWGGCRLIHAKRNVK